jgi:phosphoketolase
VVGGRGDLHIIRVYLAPDTNTLLSVAGHCLRSRQYVNVIVASQAVRRRWPGRTCGELPAANRPFGG